MTIENAFAMAADDLFGDANLTVEATYTPAGGLAVTLPIVLRRPDQEINLGVSGLQVTSWQAKARAKDLPPAAAPGDGLAIGADTFTVRQIERDALNLVVSLDLDKNT